MAQDNEKKQPKSFQALTPELSQWILDFTEGMGFARTTPVQAMAIPLLMGNKDLVVEAVTGSGKTLSFLMPLVERILKAEEPNKKGYVRSIVIAPTKELASQIFDVLCSLIAFHAPSDAMLNHLNKPEKDDDDNDNTNDRKMDVDEEHELLPGPYVIPQLLTGGRTKLAEDISSFATLNPNVLIGTPKRLLEVLQSPKVVLKRHWFDLLVLDEADRLLDSNFKPDLQKILDLVPKERRTGLFSASVSEAVNELVRIGMRYPFKISAKVRSKSGALDKSTPESLRLYHVITKPSRKLPQLRCILEQTKAEKSIIYVSTRAGVDYWNHVFPKLLGVTVFPLHGDYKSAVRTKNLRRFRECQTPALLLTTDVLARGIDISGIDLVIQLDPPTQPKDFIHRCGRSGRAGRRGTAITFLNEGSEEDYVKYLEVKGVKVEPYPSTPLISEADAIATTALIRQILSSKRELHDRSQKAFVSWIQAFTKTVPGEIFNMKKFDWAEHGKAWGLLQWPKMPELRKTFSQAAQQRDFMLDLPSEFNIDNVAYANDSREAARQSFMEAKARGERPTLTGKAGGALAEMKRRKERAWSGQKEARAVRESRREKKEIRRRAESKSKMSEAEKIRDMELTDLIAKVKAQNANLHEDDFQGFDD